MYVTVCVLSIFKEKGKKVDVLFDKKPIKLAECRRLFMKNALIPPIDSQNFVSYIRFRSNRSTFE